jgi:hypothetical protein
MSQLECSNPVEVEEMSDLWFYSQNGQQKDPVPSTQLKHLASSGSLQPTDLVWKEGMPNWVPANQIAGLFTAAQPQPVPAGSYQKAPTPYQQPASAPVPSQAAQAPIDPFMDEPDEFGPRPNRSKKKKKGMSIGVIIGIIAGVLVAVGLVTGVLIWAMNSPLVTGESGSRIWSLKANEKADYHFTFEKGKFVVIEVKSDLNSDVDLAVYDGTTKIASDNHQSKDCKVSFIAPDTKSYRIEVWNTCNVGVPPWRHLSNSGTVSYHQKTAGPLDVPLPFKLVSLSSTNPPIELPLKESDSRGWSLKTQEKAYFHIILEKDKFVVIEVKSNANSDMDLVVYDGPSKIAEDVSLSKNCKVSLIAPATKAYRVEVWNRRTIEPGRNLSNSGIFSYHQKEPGPNDMPLAFVEIRGIPLGVKPPIAKPPVFNNNPPFNPNPNLPPGAVAPPKNIDQTFNGILPQGGTLSYIVQLNANTTYIIDAKSKQFDTYLTLEDIATNKVVTTDDDGGEGLNSRIIYNPKQTKSYRIHIQSFANSGGGAYTLTVGH